MCQGGGVETLLQSVKSDIPWRPGGWFWWKITCCCGPWGRFPLPHAPLKGAPGRRQVALGITQAKIAQDGHRAQVRRSLKQGNHLAFPDIAERIGSAAAVAKLRLLQRRKAWVFVKPCGGVSRRCVLLSFIYNLACCERSSGSAHNGARHPGSSCWSLKVLDIWQSWRPQEIREIVSQLVV